MAKKGNIKKFATKETAERPVRFRRYKYLFLIVCEDEKTEPSYFEKYKYQIPEDTIFLKPVGTGRDPKGVVERAIEERYKLELQAKKEVDEVWVVFDKDDADENATKIQKFNEAFKIAKKENMEVAYSNEVFELWLLLHFTDVDSQKPLPRNDIYQLLEEQIRKIEKYNDYVYDHRKPNPQTIEIVFEFGSFLLAIERAKILLDNQKGRKPIDANPSTKVHTLIQQLLDWIKYYSYLP